MSSGHNAHLVTSFGRTRPREDTGSICEYAAISAGVAKTIRRRRDRGRIPGSRYRARGGREVPPSDRILTLTSATPWGGARLLARHSELSRLPPFPWPPSAIASPERPGGRRGRRGGAGGTSVSFVSIHCYYSIHRNANIEASSRASDVRDEFISNHFHFDFRSTWPKD